MKQWTVAGITLFVWFVTWVTINHTFLTNNQDLKRNKISVIDTNELKYRLLETSSSEREMQKRKLENDMQEFSRFINSHVKKLKVTNMSEFSGKVGHIMQGIQGFQRTVLRDIQRLFNLDHMEQWRMKESKELGDLVQHRIEKLQNPKDCNSKKKLFCSVKPCGFGCRLHRLTVCLIAAYALGRTMIFNSVWDSIFLPVSRSCRTLLPNTTTDKSKDGLSQENKTIIWMEDIDNLIPRPDYLPMAVPADLSSRLMKFHGNPGLWWVGQFNKYLTRPNQRLQHAIFTAETNLNFSGPIVGIHIRRTDKVSSGEAAFHHIDEYMKHAEEYFDNLENPDTERKVYIATDDLAVIYEAKQKYPGYKVLGNPRNAKSYMKEGPYAEESLLEIMLDIHFLSRCDFVVCTLSSGFCRLAYGLMQTVRGDASSNLQSLDDVYYLIGQNPHHVIAIESHIASNNNEIDLHVGDIILMAGNHWDGFSKGKNLQTGKEGLYPSYKTKEIQNTAKMPTYENGR